LFSSYKLTSEAITSDQLGHNSSRKQNPEITNVSFCSSCYFTDSNRIWLFFSNQIYL